MNSDSILGSNLTFSIKSGKDIREILQLIQTEAKKGNCSDSEITLISTAVSEVCRRFMKFGSLELSLSILTRREGMELRGKAYVQTILGDTDWYAIMQSLDSYFSETVIQEHDNSASLSYSFLKKIPRVRTAHPKPRSGPSVDNLSG